MNKRANQPIKVLLLLHQLSPGGAPKVAIDTFSALEDHLDVRAVSAAGGDWECRARQTFPLFVYRADARGSLLRKVIHRLLRPLRCLVWSANINRWKPDVIYINSVSSLLLAKSIRLPKTPVILHVHETGLLLESIGSQYSEILRELPARYIAVSESVSTALQTQYGIASDKIAVIGNFVDDKIVQSKEQRNYGSSFVVGGVGMLWWYKGGVLWLQMARELIRLLPDRPIKFVWVGVKNDTEGRRFREMARKFGVDKHIDFVEPQADMSRYYAAFDVVAVTSWEESFSLVALEAMSRGKLVACFAGSGGTPEVVGDTGIVVNDFSPAQMAKEIADLAGSPEKMRELGLAARTRAQDCFSAQRQVSLIYEEIRKTATMHKGRDGHA